MNYPSLQNMTLLLVENDETVKEIICEIVRVYVKEIYIAQNGEAGLELYKSIRPDLVITEIMIPKKNGLDMAEEIRAFDADARIIVATSLYDHNVLVRAVNIGITAFMNKPVFSKEMLKLLEKQANFSLVKNEYLKNKKLLEEYKQAVDTGSIVSKTDPYGIITYANDEFCNISGYSREELVGNHHNIVRHPDMPKEVFKDLWTTIQSQKVWKGKIKNLRKDGTFYYVNSTIIPIIDENNNTVEYIALRQDITELEQLNKNLEERVAQELEKNSQKDKALIASLEKIHDSSPNPIIVFQDDKVSFANKRFLHISGLEHSVLINQQFDLSSLFENRKGFITRVEDIDRSVDTNKVSVAGKNGRNIFYIIENTIDLPLDESFEMFTFNNITLSEYQKIKMTSYNSRLEDFIKGMGKKVGKSENKDEAVDLSTVRKAVPSPTTKIKKDESVESKSIILQDARTLSTNEKNILKRTRLESEISSAEYAADIDDYVLIEIQELAELETEINEALTAFEEEKCVNQLQIISAKLTRYASTINQLFEFGDLAFSVDSLAALLMILTDEDMTDLKVRKIELFLSNILLDLANWRRTIFVDQSTNDIHYFDASLFSAILQLELVLNEGQKIEEDDDDDFELF